MSKVLILGASGTIGSAMMRAFLETSAFEVWGTVRSNTISSHFSPEVAARIKVGINVETLDSLTQIFAELRPDIVINCIGLVKQISFSNNPLSVMPVNALLPHQIANLCNLTGSRLVHFSTDCIFSGSKGNYGESDPMDVNDLYGMSKFIGEPSGENTVTLRTSFIGHELETSHELIEWFLKQKGSIKGFTKAIYTGLPTIVLSRLVRDVVLPNSDLSGVYHVASQAISKYDLLKLVAKVYGKSIEILPDDSVAIDRSLNAERFRQATGYVPPAWPELISHMFESR